MSVQSEIDRIAGAKSDISTAITNKGVTVPSGTKLDGMAALINSIESGGGGGGGVETCTFYIHLEDSGTVYATVYENGEIIARTFNFSSEITIQNLVRNSCLTFYTRIRFSEEKYSETVTVLLSYSSIRVLTLSGDGSANCI